MKLQIEINTDNAAFEDFPEVEVARILQEVIDRIIDSGINQEFPLIEINGNTCGRYKVTRKYCKQN